MLESNFYEDVTSRYEPPTITHAGSNRQYSGKKHSQWNGKAKNISSNRHEILLVQRQSPKKPFHIIWEEGKKNPADYITKHHPIWHHRAMRPRYAKASKKIWKTQNTRKLVPGKGVLELPIPGEPGNRVIPIRESGIRFPRTRIVPLGESGI